MSGTFTTRSGQSLFEDVELALLHHTPRSSASPALDVQVWPQAARTFDRALRALVNSIVEMKAIHSGGTMIDLAQSNRRQTTMYVDIFAAAVDALEALLQSRNRNIYHPDVSARHRSRTL